jgi:hypothetical protein
MFILADPEATDAFRCRRAALVGRDQLCFNGSHQGVDRSYQ